MSDRLAELRRQRELLQQHLAWIDREITAEQAKENPAETAAKLAAAVALAAPKTSSASARAPAASPAAASPSAGSVIAANASPDADRILEEYRVPPRALHSDVRKGCLLYFAAALALFIGVVAILYFALSRR